MSRKKKRKKHTNDHLPYDIYEKALNQDPEAVHYIVKHYNGYISGLASTQYHLGGRDITVVDETLKKDLENHLISAIMNYGLNGENIKK